MSPLHLPPCPGKNLHKSRLALRRKQQRKTQQEKEISGTVVYQTGWLIPQQPHLLPGGQQTPCPLEPLSVNHSEGFHIFCICVVLLPLNSSDGEQLGMIVCHCHRRLPAVRVQVTIQRHSSTFTYTLKDPE